ncbi:hypothetical protein EVJ58_g9645 [Rhodofomes roseus]|uniref:Uncharacterized protein n=1 Tax=Rhodofomes roseus TaxID=34475 RepID=A0A4Y9XVB0_9APHY|nr:hypothetical protein EVJ58_g9645 [Rhodofomes roseus]
MTRFPRRSPRSCSPRERRQYERPRGRQPSPRQISSPSRREPRVLSRSPPPYRREYGGAYRQVHDVNPGRSLVRPRRASPTFRRHSRSPASSTGCPPVNRGRSPLRPPASPPRVLRETHEERQSLVDRIAPEAPTPAVRSLAERLAPVSLLERLAAPQEAVDEEIGESSSTSTAPSLFNRLAIPLESRLSDTLTAGPSTIAPATPPPTALHIVTLPSGIPLRTRLPLFSAAEVDEYLHHPFERSENIAPFRQSWEHELGPAPYFPAESKRPLPSPQLLLADGDEGYLATVLWIHSRTGYIDGLLREPHDWPALIHKQWKSRLRGNPDLVRAAKGTSVRPLPDTVLLPLRNPLPNEKEDAVWELRTFQFRYNFERLAAELLPGLRAASTESAKGAIWASTRDRVRRTWGPGTTHYPSVHEPRYLDSDDDLVRLRHWFAIGRLMLEWDLRADVTADLQLAMGGSVTDAVERIKSAYTTTYKMVFKNRDPHVFCART